jgi:broad specificity phosphatase PhoE
MIAPLSVEGEMAPSHCIDLHFIRHGQTRARPGVLVGATDIELSEQGKKTMLRLGPCLPDGLDCLCSPLIRARQSLACLQSGCTVASVSIVDELREIDFGSYELHSFADLAGQEEDVSAMARDYQSFVFPGGEAVADFLNRLKQFQNTLHAFRKQEKSLLIVSHGGVIRSLICLLLGLDVEKYLLFEIGYGSWTTVRLFSEGGVLTRLNVQPTSAGPWPEK